QGCSHRLPDYTMRESLSAAHPALQPIPAPQLELQKAIGKAKREPAAAVENAALKARVRAVGGPLLQTALATPGKLERAAKFDEAKSATLQTLAAEFPEAEKDVAAEFSRGKYEAVRQMIVKDKRRLDGRALDEIRPISCEVGFLPRTHGSALFTRGETQALVATTLGTGSDQQRIDALLGETFKRFMLHYNFP